VKSCPFRSASGVNVPVVLIICLKNYHNKPETDALSSVPFHNDSKVHSNPSIALLSLSTHENLWT